MKKQSFVTMGTVLMLLILGGFWSSTDPDIFKPARAAAADQIINPAIIAIDPVSAPNDLNTPITITGADFATDLSGTPPTVSLGNVYLEDVTWIDSTTLTATAPWGLDTGIYTLTVTNPDGGTANLENAFSVKQGIGQWNGGNIFGGEVRQILMKPDDPNTLYASAYGIIGLFRSQDAGEHWAYVSADVAINNGKFAIDPLHPDWLYGFDYKGLHRSEDEGVTWTTLMPNTWPDGRSMNYPQVFVSSYDPQILFVSSYQDYGNPYVGEAFGLIKSTNGGTSWQIIADLEGLAVQDISFHPTDPLKMVLVTSDARVFQSADGGNTWNEVLKPPLSSLDFRGVITYNPYNPSEVWVASISAGIYKSTDASFSNWQNMTPTDGAGAWNITFSNADSVYITRHHSTDGGLTWQSFGTMTSYGELRFNPDDPQIGYLGDDTYGVQKTTDGGQTWQIKNQGLAGLRCNSLDVSQANPLRIFATFGDGMGIYRSDDGAINWTYLPIAGSIHVGLVSEDPLDPQRLYVASHSNIYVSTDAGENWSDLGWNAPPSSPAGMLWTMAPDPFQAGHLLVGSVSGSWGLGTGLLYSSSNYGVSWQAVIMPQNIAWTTDIAFDPETPGLVYLSTNGTGVYRSTNSGTSWERIDNQQQLDMKYVGSVAIATHPQHMLFIGTSPYPYRSLDNGTTWEKAQRLPNGGSDFMFADGNSGRLYFGTGIGLFLSSNVGDSWTRAAGVLGQLQILALGYTNMDGNTVLYAATSGGSAATASAGAQALANDSGLVEAGIYRYVQQAATGLPNIPVLAVPANTAIVNHYTPLLDWSDVTANYHYQVQVDDNADFSPPLYHVKNLKTSEYQFSDNLTRGATYYWRVRSLNTLGGTKGWSQVWSFKVGDVPAKFSKSNPLNSAVNQPVILTLKWAKSNGITPAASYEYCYDTTDDNNCASWRSAGLYTSAELRGLLPEQTYYWHVRAVNYFGLTTSNSNTWYSFTTGPTMTDFYDSQPTNDGWTLESSEFSNIASTKSNISTLRVGDDAKNKQYRSLLYFDTSSLPNNALISKVDLKITKASETGSTATLGNLVADMKKGAFGLAPLELTDFNAAGASLNTAGSFSGSYQLTLSPVNFKYVNLMGVTQFRLRFTKDDDNDKTADFISLYAGEDATNAPQLIVEYSLP